jgi:SAM-dependent methyltransferase
MPRTLEEFELVLDRIELNFGSFLSYVPKDSPILDVPCGVGYLEHYLLKIGFTKIHAVDLSDEQIRIAKDKLEEHGLGYDGKVEFHVNDAFEYLSANKGFAVIAMIDFLEHLEKERIVEILDLANKALQDGGLLLVRVINADNPMWSRFFYHDFTHETPFTFDSLRQCLSITGFEVIRLDYERLPKPREVSAQVKGGIRWMGLWLLGKFLGIPPEAFSENLIAVARRQ